MYIVLLFKPIIDVSCIYSLIVPTMVSIRIY